MMVDEVGKERPNLGILCWYQVVLVTAHFLPLPVLIFNSGSLPEGDGHRAFE